jgi:hypothetical protein
MRQWVRAALLLSVLAGFAVTPASAAADADSYRGMVMADDPAGYWRLEEDAGPLGRNEVAGGQRLRYFQHPLLDEDGAFAGSRGATAGFRTMLDLGPPVGSDTDSTYETWFRIQSGMDSENYEHVIEVPADWGVWVYDGFLTAGCSEGNWAGGPKMTDGKWHHVAVRLTEGRMEVFLDGVREINTTCGYDRGSDRVLAGWGGGRVGFVQATARTYDEMAMYARALPDDRIVAHAAARTAADAAAPPPRAPLTGGPYTSEVLADEPWAYFRFDDRPFNPDGTPSRLVQDSSGNGHHGAMNLGGMDRAPGPITSEARNVSMRPRSQGFWIAGPTSADLSVEVWVKLNHETERSVDNAWIGGGRFAMLFRGEELSVPPAHLITWQDNLWNDHAWHQIVATKDTATDTLTIYRDGRFQRTMPDADDSPYFNGFEQMMSLLGGNALDPGHCVDEISIYESVLSAERVAAHYDAANAELAKGGCGGTSDVRPDQRPPAPQNTSLPRARGVAEPGNVVWCDPGEWTGDPHHFRQLWYRDGVARHASEWAYEVTADDAGHELTCRVVATGPGGDSLEASSEPLGASGQLLPPGQPRMSFPDEDVRAAVTLAWDPTPADPVPADGYIVQSRDAGGAWHTISRPEGPSAILFNQAEGRIVYRVIAYSAETESEPSPESEPVLIDRTAPSPARLVVAGTPAHGEWYRDTVSATWEHDGDPDLADGTPGTGLDPASVPPDEVSFSTTGVHRVSARLRDLAGNSALTERDLYVDADAPQLTLDCPAVAHVGAIAHADVVASDGGGSGLAASVPDELTVDTATPGVRTLSLTAADNVGHETTATCDVPVIHRRPNAPALVAGSSPGNGAVTIGWTRHASSPPPAAYVLEGRDANDAGWTEIARGPAESWTAPAGSPLAQGTWTFRVRIDDPDFDPEPSEMSAPVVVDRTAPAAPSIAADRPADAPGDWFRDTVTLTFSGAGDPDLPDGSPGSGLDPASVPAAATYSTAGSYTASGTVRDRAGTTSSSASRTVRVDTSAPSAAITCPAANVVQDSSATASWTASDTGSGLAGAASGTVALATGAIGTHTASPPEVRDRVGHVAPSVTCSYRVVYDWTGFLDPVTSGPEYNRVDAGEVVPVMWSLNGNRGLGVLSGTPATIASSGCNGQRNDVSWTLPASWAAGLEYYAQFDLYLWPFRTQSSWRNTCRQLTVTLNDGTSHTAIFRFR